MKKNTLTGLLLLFILSSCASGITSAQKRELTSYKSKGLYVQEKNPGLAAGLGLLPGGGSFYTREYGIGVVNLLFWPASILWEPMSGQRAAERINYYSTKENINTKKKREFNELDDLYISGDMNNKVYVMKKRQIEDRYSAD